MPCVHTLLPHQHLLLSRMSSMASRLCSSHMACSSVASSSPAPAFPYTPTHYPQAPPACARISTRLYRVCAPRADLPVRQGLHKASACSHTTLLRLHMLLMAIPVAPHGRARAELGALPCSARSSSMPKRSSSRLASPGAPLHP
jgi:hypothetical protein